MYNQWLPSSKDSTFMILKKQRQQKTDTKGLTVRHCNFFHVQIHCACQWIMTLPPKILWPTALLNTWNIITFPKSSFYHTNHTFLTNINVWMMDFSSINTRIKKISSAQNTILCREWLLQKLTFRHSEITIFNHSHNPTQRTFGEPQAPSVYIHGMKYYCRVILGWCHKPWNQDFTECHRGQKRNGKILQLWSIFPGVWMVWVGPEKDGNWEITRKSETWRRLGESNTMLKCIWVVFVDEFWRFLTCQFANCSASGRAFLQWNRTCGRATQSHLWISKVARRWPTGFSWSPGGVELRDFPIAMIIIFINEAPKKNPNHSARGFVSDVFQSFTTKKMRKMNPSFDYHVFFNLVNPLQKEIFESSTKFQNMGAPNQSLL